MIKKHHTAEHASAGGELETARLQAAILSALGRDIDEFLEEQRQLIDAVCEEQTGSGRFTSDPPSPRARLQLPWRMLRSREG